MSNVTMSLETLNHSFDDVIAKVESGVYTTVSILDNEGIEAAAVVGKVVSKLAFDTQNAWSAQYTTTERPQTYFARRAEFASLDAMYRLTRFLRSGNAIVDTGTAATLVYTSSPGGITFTAKASGTVVRSMQMVNPGADGTLSVEQDEEVTVVTLAYGSGAITSTMALVAAAINADTSLPITALATGTTSTLATALAETELAGGVDNLAFFKTANIYRTSKMQSQARAAFTRDIRAVLISKTHADHLGL